MNRLLIRTMRLVTILLISSSCARNVEVGKTVSDAKGSTTLYGNTFLHGKISSIVYEDKDGNDSIQFVYNKEKHLYKSIFYVGGKEDGYCNYGYNGSNRIDLHYYDNNNNETSYSIVEFDDRKNITLWRDYGYIYPDTTKMVLLYMKHDSYDKDNRRDVAFEYFCDGIPPYKYRYSYNSDGIEMEECCLAVTGEIYTITKRIRDKMGNVVDESENMPRDNSEWSNVKIEYKYDDKGNWVERKITGSGSLGYLDRHSKRKIHYLDE